MEMYRDALAALQQLKASDIIAALALLVSTLSFLSSRRTAKRAVKIAEKTLNERGRLAGARWRYIESTRQWAFRVISGSDPTVLNRIELHLASHEAQGSIFSGVVHHYVTLPFDPSLLAGVNGPDLPVSLTPFQSVEWVLPPFPNGLGNAEWCVHVWAKAEDALGRAVTSPTQVMGFHGLLLHSRSKLLVNSRRLRERLNANGTVRSQISDGGRIEGHLLPDWLSRMTGRPTPGDPREARPSKRQPGKATGRSTGGTNDTEPDELIGPEP